MLIADICKRFVKKICEKVTVVVDTTVAFLIYLTRMSGPKVLSYRYQ